jgi:hypothetical protein
MKGGEEADSLEIDEDSTMSKGCEVMKAQLMATRNSRQWSAW